MSENKGPHCLIPNVAMEYLRDSPLGNELDSAELDALSKNVCARELAGGEFLIEAGTSDDSVHVLVSGRLEVVTPSLASEPVTLHVLSPGDLAGEMSFVDGTEHSVGLRALNDCRVVSLQRPDFESLIDSHPRLIYKVMRAIVRSAHEIVTRMNLQYVEMTRYFYKSSGRY